MRGDSNCLSARYARVMRRRQLIAAAGTALSTASAGCLEGVLDGREARRVSLADVGSVGGDYPLELAVSMDSPTLGPESAPTLAVELRATADQPLYVGNANAWPADGLMPERESDPRGLRLLSELEASDLTIENRECPVTTYRPITEETLGGHLVTPGETHRTRYQLVGSAEALDGPCPPGGQYSFHSTYVYTTAEAVENVGFETADKSSFDWGFAVDVPAEA